MEMVIDLALLNHRRIVRREGLVLFLAYVGYVVWRAIAPVG